MPRSRPKKEKNDESGVPPLRRHRVPRGGDRGHARGRAAVERAQGRRRGAGARGEAACGRPLEARPDRRDLLGRPAREAHLHRAHGSRPPDRRGRAGGAARVARDRSCRPPARTRRARRAPARARRRREGEALRACGRLPRRGGARRRARGQDRGVRGVPALARRRVDRHRDAQVLLLRHLALDRCDARARCLRGRRGADPPRASEARDRARDRAAARARPRHARRHPPHGGRGLRRGQRDPRPLQRFAAQALRGRGVLRHRPRGVGAPRRHRGDGACEGRALARACDGVRPRRARPHRPGADDARALRLSAHVGPRRPAAARRRRVARRVP